MVFNLFAHPFKMHLINISINISTKFEQKLAHLLSSIFANLLQIQLVIVANRRVTNTDTTILLSSRSTFFFPHTHTFTFRRLKLPGNVTSIKMEYSWRGRILSVVEKLKICKGNRKPEKIVGKPNEVTERAKEFFSFISRRMSLHGIMRPWNFFVRCWNRNWPTWMCDVKNEDSSYNNNKLARKECFVLSFFQWKHIFFSSFPKL